MPRKTRPRPLSEIFPEDWIQGVRKALADVDNSDLNKQDRRPGTAIRTAVAYRRIAHLAIIYTPPETLGKIVTDAETICNRVGASLTEDRDDVSKCLTKKHSECTGSYLNVFIHRTIICKCPCHTKTEKTS